MDLDMPPDQLEAWDKLKTAVNDYAGITGNEIAVVTAYLTSMSTQTVDSALVSPTQSFSFYGHGVLLQQVRQSIDRLKKEAILSNNNNVKNGWSSSPSANIPIHQQMNSDQNTHYNQSMARSLCSSYRSLKLGEDANRSFMAEFNTPAIGQSGDFPPSNASHTHSSRRSNKRGSRKKSARNVNGDNFELDENLLFEEPSRESSNEDDDFDSDSDSTDLSENSFGRPTHFPPRNFQRPNPAQQAQNQFATSLPVNISINWGQKNDGTQRFRDNQGPHPPLHQHQPKTVIAQPPQQAIPTRPTPRNQDTPNPETMMASIQALARSVTDDSALIFGERPRPRLNTGESRMGHARR